MNYDTWKAHNPADEFLGPEPDEEFPMEANPIHDLFLRIGDTCLDEDLDVIIEACLAMALEAAGRSIIGKKRPATRADMDAACAIIDRRWQEAQQLAKDYVKEAARGGPSAPE